MWTIEEITRLCEEYCGRCGIEFNSPVSINGRLTRTLGRCFYEKKQEKWYPTKIEISRQLLKTATDRSIKEVIAHECAHYVVAAITHEDHGHDATFRYYCALIRTTNDTYSYENIEYTKSNDEIYKYTLYCSKCGSFLIGRSRACAVTKNPERYSSKCCYAKIRVSKNWQEV